MKKLLYVVLVFTLTLSLCCAAFPAFAASAPEETIAVISDIHYLPKAMIGSADGFNYRREVDNDRKLEQYSAEILEEALRNVRESGASYLLIPGDLVLSGHYDAHVEVTEKLRALQETGVKVYVIPGNHDISRADKPAYRYEVTDPQDTFVKAGTTYVRDKKVEVKGTTLSDFRELYAEFGMGNGADIIARATDSLSYVAQLPGYRLIAVDASNYEGGYFTNKKELTPERRSWIASQIAQAKEAGDIPLVMMHYCLVEKYESQSLLLGANFLDDREQIAGELAQSGVQYLFTGHSHANDVASLTTESGNTLFEICTGSLLLYGSPVRTVALHGQDAEISTSWLGQIAGIPDYGTFCDNYFDTEGVRTALRNRVIFDVSDILTDTFCKVSAAEPEFREAFQELMTGVCDRLLALELTEDTTVCDVLGEAYHQHYKGDEVYSQRMQQAVGQLKNGSAWNRALLIVEEELGKATALQQLLEKYSDSYNDGTLRDVANIINASLAPLLGPLMGTFLENTFIDKAPGDNSLSVVGGKAVSTVQPNPGSVDMLGKIVLFFENLVNFLKVIFRIVK